MEIKDILVQAQKAVDDGHISEDLRSVAFGKAIDMLARGAATGLGDPNVAAPRVAMPTRSGETLSERISRKLSLPAEQVGEVFSDDDQGGMSVVIGVGKLDNSTATATKQLSLLVCGARQLSELEQWTESKHLRNVCVHYGRYDSPNFAKTIKQMDDAFSFKGKGQQLEVKLHQRGIEKVKQLIGILTTV